MTVRVAFRLVGAILIVGLAASSTLGYIHFPPKTLPQMCKESHHIRELKVEKFDKEKRVIIFTTGSASGDGAARATSSRSRCSR